jgi:hypothetical protein
MVDQTLPHSREIGTDCALLPEGYEGLECGGKSGGSPWTRASSGKLDQSVERETGPERRAENGVKPRLAARGASAPGPERRAGDDSPWTLASSGKNDW